jgi:hypothetical protein
MKIYLDMDDVVADWMGYARAYLRMDWQPGEMVPDDKWRSLRDDQRMYSKLPLKEGARNLVDWCERYVGRNPGTELYFLSAIPHNNDMPWAIQDKVFWAYKYFPGIPVFLGPYSHDKWVRCQPGDILIDDRTSNCEEWIRAGGHAHIYRNWTDCKIWLESLLQTSTTTNTN